MAEKSSLGEVTTSRGCVWGHTWTPSEDAHLLRLYSSVPRTRWSDIADSLGGGLTANAVRMRFQRFLKFDDVSSGEPLSTKERALLDRALDEVETGREKWWGREGIRELGKVGAKRWCENIKKESGVDGKKIAATGSGRGAKRAKIEEDAEEEKEGEDGEDADV
ncbi:hypothetical protein BZA05DRAFT_433703 [Tricharina praecox]|uniref:uncharacterized protein n=1 Tax=Tricharina praecox TaxID=43433 RepID=UPI00221FD5A1|nr:uncharacterized protein BZA05DRAFT_433703 [Tricharina praecox]KAI5857039.1 hypothetical protein BZA05DRAFT_433703 [Tricharina praecox]